MNLLKLLDKMGKPETAKKFEDFTDSILSFPGKVIKRVMSYSIKRLFEIGTNYKPKPYDYKKEEREKMGLR